MQPAAGSPFSSAKLHNSLAKFKKVIRGFGQILILWIIPDTKAPILLLLIYTGYDDKDIRHKMELLR